jgi:hypothetical protein
MIIGPFHSAMVVPNIDAAMEELSRALGLKWQVPHTSHYGDSTIQVAYSINGPPYLELIQGEPHGPWNTTGGPRLDHIGYWSDDIQTDKRSLEEHGVPIDVDGESLGNPRFTYHRAPLSGLRLELIDSAASRALLQGNMEFPEFHVPRSD